MYKKPSMRNHNQADSIIKRFDSSLSCLKINLLVLVRNKYQAINGSIRIFQGIYYFDSIGICEKLFMVDFISGLLRNDFRSIYNLPSSVHLISFKLLDIVGMVKMCVNFIHIL